MKDYFKLYIFLIALTGGIWSGCVAPQATSSASYIGEYESLVKDTPNGDIQGTFTIKHDGSNYFATIGSDQGSRKVEDFKIDGNILTGYFNIESYKINLKGTITGNNISGNMEVEGNTMPWTAIKK